MSSELPQIEELFAKATEIADPVARQQFLDQHMAPDSPQRQLLDNLIESHFSQQPVIDEISEILATARDELLQLSGPDLPAQELADFVSSLTNTEEPGYVGQFGHYLVAEVLGSSAAGIVLKCQDKYLGRCVALKVMRPSLAESPGARQRFLDEARATAQVDHPNVISIYAVHDEFDYPCMVMEFIDGGDLRSRLSEEPLDFDTSTRLLRDIASGLTAAHEAGLVHRDIKPANILLRASSDAAVITDFGLAEALEEGEGSKLFRFAGTPQYMSPEQAQEEPVDHRSDLFSLGAVLYHMCTGHAPFSGQSNLEILQAVVECDPQKPSELREIPTWLERIILRLMQREPTARYATTSELLTDIDKNLKTVDSTDSQEPDGSQSSASRGWVSPRTMMAAVFVATVGVLVWMQSGSNDDGIGNPTKVLKPAKLPPTALTRIDPANGVSLQKLASREYKLPQSFTNSIGMQFSLIPPGKVEADMPQAKDGGHPQCGLLYMGSHEVSAKQFARVMGNDVGTADADGSGDVAVANISWEQALDFCQRLSSLGSEEGRTYRLPTVSEWTYIVMLNLGSRDLASIGAPAQGENGPTNIQSGRPGHLGVVNLEGNVWEWCFTESVDNRNQPICGGGWANILVHSLDLFADKPLEANPSFNMKVHTESDQKTRYFCPIRRGEDAFIRFDYEVPTEFLTAKLAYNVLNFSEELDSESRVRVQYDFGDPNTAREIFSTPAGSSEHTYDNPLDIGLEVQGQALVRIMAILRVDRGPLHSTQFVRSSPMPRLRPGRSYIFQATYKNSGEDTASVNLIPRFVQSPVVGFRVVCELRSAGDR